MNVKGKRKIITGLIFVLLFGIFTRLLQLVDVKPIGVNGTDIGFSAFNRMLHGLLGVNMSLYTITDWLSLVPVFVVLGFGMSGLIQLIKRKSLFKVDTDILILGGYYITVAALYILFENVTINFRPVLINGFQESSYPSSTTLLVLGVMPTFSEQIKRRCKAQKLKITLFVFSAAFTVLMVVGRLLSGVHWVTDIFGSVLISAGLFYIYKGLILIFTLEK